MSENLSNRGTLYRYLYTQYVIKSEIRKTDVIPLYRFLEHMKVLL